MSRKSYYDSAVARTEVLGMLRAAFSKDVISLKEFNAFVRNPKNGIKNYPYFIKRERKVGRGRFSLADVVATPTIAPQVRAAVAEAAEIGRAHV